MYISAEMKTCLLIAMFTTVFAVRRPPAIILQPSKDVYFKAAEQTALPCHAEGEPEPTYSWKRNGHLFLPSGIDGRIVQYANGTLFFNKPEDKDEGIYQCLASNHYGTSVSVNINLRAAFLMDFPVRPTREHMIHLGQPLTLSCVPPRSVPPPEIEWGLRDQYGRLTAINYTRRVTMDPEGRLHITNVMEEHFQNGNIYTCMAVNYFVRQNKYDGGHIIRPQGTSEIKSAPQYLWTSPSDMLGVKGDTFRLKCIYSGNPTPDVHWIYPDGTSTKPDKIVISSEGQEISIPNLQESDAGEYKCYGLNTLGNGTTRSLNIRVQSKPTWTEEPRDIEATLGANATFTCKADGNPTPNIVWYANGVKLADSTNPTINSAKFLKPSPNNIIILNLVMTDTMVLQCNASNRHGYVFADVYLHVSGNLVTGEAGH